PRGMSSSLGRTHKEDEVGGKRQEEEARQARSSARARQMSGPASAAGTTGDAARPGPRGIRERTGLSRPVSPRSWLGSSSWTQAVELHMHLSCARRPLRQGRTPTARAATPTLPGNTLPLGSACGSASLAARLHFGRACPSAGGLGRKHQTDPTA
ncbi:unnamed protein product, partial [Prorocentrum cordatum]